MDGERDGVDVEEVEFLDVFRALGGGPEADCIGSSLVQGG